MGLTGMVVKPVYSIEIAGGARFARVSLARLVVSEASRGLAH